MPETYSRDEVKEILGRALERQHAQGDALTHDELAAVAREMGVAPEALARAAAAVKEERAVEAAVAGAVARRRRSLTAHLIAFAMVNALLAVGNLMAGGPLWFVLVALGWGIGLAFHARAAFAPDRERMAVRARRRLEREREAAERQRRKREAEESARRIGKAVEAGVVEVLKTVADVIDPARHAEAERKGTGVRVEVAPERAPEPDEAARDHGATGEHARRG